MSGLHLVLAVLATWRVTHLLQAEDGPFSLVLRLRRALGNSLLGLLLDCFQCLSLWVAAPFALLVADRWGERGLAWLALSGGAILLERLGRTEPAATARWVEDEENDDVVLR